MNDKVMAFETYVEPVRQRMVRSIWRLVRDADDVEDVLQEALERILKVLHKLWKHPNPTALILRISINAAYDHLRRKKQWVVLEEQKQVSFQQISILPNPAEDLEQQERLRRVLKALSHLPRREMEALTLLAVEELTYAEVAAAMGCRENSVRSMIAKARKRLARWEAQAETLNGLEVQES
ncbi:sigma-70 family RNA polymerase sigma factor [bacterium]|nr:sigma-70 family RNA polymerase sigma factor [bacterium]